MRYISKNVRFKLNNEVFLFNQEHFILLPAHIVLYQYINNEENKLEEIKYVVFIQKPSGDVYARFPSVTTELDQVVNGLVIALDLHELLKPEGYPKTTELLCEEALEILRKNKIST